jgi:DNA polymerase-3 subunit alpha
MSQFAHLRVHSTYSLSEGASKIAALVSRAKEAGIPAVALTDRNNLFGAMVFSKEASYAGVQPIVGCQVYMEWAEGKRGNVLLLARDGEGYANLCALLRSASDPRPGKDGKPVTPECPVLDPETLRERSAGLFLLTGGGADGLLPTLAARPGDAAAQTYQWLLSVFGDRLYVEICRSGPPDADQRAVEDALVALATGAAGPVACDDGQERSEAPLVATSDVWYATPDRHDAWVLLGHVVNKTTVTMNGDAISGAGAPRHFLRTAAEMRDLFVDLPEAFDNAANLARRCAFMVKGRAPILPAFPCEAGRTEEEELRAQGRSGLEARLLKAGLSGEAAADHWARLEFELDMIAKMGFPGYFLIVSDFIKWAKAHGIPVGPGRGSGAGSIVAWALTITDLDPLEFGLLFERFLNPERVSMPDFDIDFCQDRREEVRDYVRAKYGADRTALISTFGYIKSKTALTDMQRTLVHDQYGIVGFGEIKQLTKAIPKKPDSADPMDLAQALEDAPEFRGMVSESPKLKNLFDQARKIEGLIRTSGSHAAGVVIADRPLDELVPVTYDEKADMQVAGFDMKGVEAAGLVKFDFLGLTTLSVLQMALGYVRDFRGVDIDIAAIPRDDAEVFRRLSDGQTTGVFQFEGGGMRKVMRQIRPNRFEDLIAIVALFRPGPMAFIDNYARRKAGDEEIVYPPNTRQASRERANRW